MSCAASFSACCPAALSASATSVSSPTAVAPPCCPSADNCFMSQPKMPPLLHRDLPVRNSHCGAAPSVAERCISSSASPPPGSCSALLHKSSGVPHEPLSPPMPTPRPSAPPGKPCPHSDTPR